MWPFKKKEAVLEKPRYRFRGNNLIHATLPAGRTDGQKAIWRQEVAVMDIKHNGNPSFGLGYYGGLS